MLVYGVYLFNRIFPEAEAINTPKASDVISASVSVNTEATLYIDKTVDIGGDELDETIAHLQSANPTRKKSLNDNPSTKPFYIIELHTAKATYQYFVYREGTKIYIEMPYTGIYISDTELFGLVLKYFEN